MKLSERELIEVRKDILKEISGLHTRKEKISEEIVERFCPIKVGDMLEILEKRHNKSWELKEMGKILHVHYQPEHSKAFDEGYCFVYAAYTKEGKPKKINKFVWIDPYWYRIGKVFRKLDAKLEEIEITLKFRNDGITT